MKFSTPVICFCGYEYPVAGYAAEKFPLSICPKCNTPINIIDPLSISVVAERLLYRGKSEMEGGDCTLSIICSAMAVECFLTRAFLKWEGIESLRLTGHLPTEDEENTWEKNYPKSEGFQFPADFVSNSLAGMKFDEFVATNTNAKLIMDRFSDSVGVSAQKYFQDTLFKKRNRILHWGNVSYDQAD